MEKAAKPANFLIGTYVRKGNNNTVKTGTFQNKISIKSLTEVTENSYYIFAVYFFHLQSGLKNLHFSFRVTYLFNI